jgi:type VI secretion system protein ImpJ
VNKPLFWEHGVFLQPQHFQLEQMQRMADLAAMASFLNPWLWGLFTLRINEDALSADMFEITELGLLTRSGQFVGYPGNATLAARSFHEVWTDRAIPLRVYLGLAPFRETGGNACATDTPETAPDAFLFTTPLNPDLIPDLHGGGPQAEVRRLRYHLRLCFNDEKENDLRRLPVARLSIEGERIVLDKSFVPPLVDISASPYLIRLLRDARDILLSRIRQLDEYKIVAGDISGGSDTTLHGVTMFSILGALSRNVPELDNMLRAPRMHPWPAFRVLCQLVGELSVFSASLSPLGETPLGERALPTYDHASLSECFSAACEIIRRLVDSLVVGPAHSLIFEPRGGHLGLSIPVNARGGDLTYWLMLRSTDVENMAERMLAQGKLAPETALAGIVSRALPGVRLIRASSPPAGLPRRKDTAYFLVDQSDPLWQTILQDGELALYLPEQPPDLWAQLSVIQQ